MNGIRMNGIFGVCVALGTDVFLGGDGNYWIFSVIPYCGNSIIMLILGGWGVCNETLNRFFSLHYLLPFILVILV